MAIIQELSRWKINMAKKGYIDNEEFKKHLIRYGELTNDVTEWWRKIDPQDKANREVKKMKKSKERIF